MRRCHVTTQCSIVYVSIEREEKDIVEFVAPGSFERSEAVALKFSRKSI